MLFLNCFLEAKMWCVGQTWDQTRATSDVKGNLYLFWHNQLFYDEIIKV